MSRREKEPFIHKGERILMERGTPGGIWDVMAARWAREDEDDQHIELVLSRGGTSMAFKTVFNENTMRHQSNWPKHILSRDITVGKPLQYKPK